jgi:hypothetical protein
MKRITPVILLALAVGCGHNHEHATENHEHPTDAHSVHGDHAGHDMRAPHAMLMVKVAPSNAGPREPADLKLMIHDAKGAMVKVFDVVHEKKVHLIIARDGLDFFAHVHPDIDADGNLTTRFTFPVAGTYRLYADYKPAGGAQTVAVGEFTVQGDAPEAPSLTPDAPGKVKGDGLDAEVLINNAKAGEAATIAFNLTDTSGKPVADLQPYLGAMGHLVILSADGKQYVHAHPTDENSAAGTVIFKAHFPEPGVYKAWGEFQRGDRVHAVPFVVKVP